MFSWLPSGALQVTECESWETMRLRAGPPHYSDLIMDPMASQITSLTSVYSTVYSGADKITSKLRVTDLCEGNSPAICDFPAQRASNAENVSIWWRHHELWGLWRWSITHIIRLWQHHQIPHYSLAIMKKSDVKRRNTFGCLNQYTAP